jgi:hypothetical protein
MMNGIGADLKCKFILLTEDALKRKESQHRLWLKITMGSRIFYFLRPNPEDDLLQFYELWVDGGSVKQIRVKDISFSAILGIEEMCTTIL